MAAPKWLGGIGTALAHRDYRLYSMGASASYLGTWIYRTGLGWFTWELTQSPAWLGIVVFCEVLPIIALVPLTGAITDRIGAYRISKASQVSACSVMAALAICTAADIMTIELLLAFVFVNGLNMSLMQPAYFALLANLVPREDLSPAVALQSSMVQTARFIGPAIGGALLIWWGTAITFVVNAVSYMALLAALLVLDYRDPETTGGASGGLFADIAQGIGYIRGHEVIRTLLLMTIAFAFLLRPVAELLPAFAADVFGRGADGLAALLSAAGGGAIFGSLWLARRGRTDGLTGLLAASSVACGVSLIAFASTDIFWLGVVLMACFGLLGNVNSISSQILMQTAVDPAMRARVMSLVGLTFRAVPAAAAALLGWLATIFGLATPTIVASLLGILGGLWLVRQIRRADLAERAEGGPDI